MIVLDEIGIWWPKSESNRHFPCGKTDFLPTSAFAASSCAVRGLDYAFISVRWLPSSLYTFPSTGLGSALASALPVKRSPNLTTFTQQIALLVLNRTSPLRLPISPLGHCRSNSGYQAQAGCGCKRLNPRPGGSPLFDPHQPGGMTGIPGDGHSAPIRRFRSA